MTDLFIKGLISISMQIDVFFFLTSFELLKCFALSEAVSGSRHI